MKLTIKGRQAMWAYIFIAVPILFFILIRIAPTLFAFNISLHEWDILSQDKPFVFFDNFKTLFKDNIFKKAMGNTVKYVFIGVPLQLIISLCIALLINRLTKGAGIFRTIYFLPYVTSTVAVAWVWRWMFMKQGGVINQIITAFGGTAQPFLDSTGQAIYVVIANIIWQSIGFNTIIFIAGLKQIPRTYYEASSIDGASPWIQFWKITIPLLNSTVVYLVVMATIQTLQVFTQVFNITGGGQGNPGGPVNSTLSLVLYIYQAGFMNNKMGLASAATIILFSIIIIITIIQLKFLTKKVEY
ncbi:sn-glycerol-3-phosphate transport system permease protein UgpA [Clostridium liquoris]|jgi:multiple sugar transport system permease protein|uniref:sn-glycerol-3-phosphate transport system permease protein UgpA n=1 Tax=Clostridium liquoris TaxID=1289519 RepID=A0A2T0B3Q4_9CLOT|nr:sugar ABC transporter permease [Clostridium liquoris]PRR78505.1 sn-glycerol-3-phosphate transport system permease protein UgpA [Clostridium liquoris]